MGKGVVLSIKFSCSLILDQGYTLSEDTVGYGFVVHASEYGTLLGLQNEDVDSSWEVGVVPPSDLAGEESACGASEEQEASSMLWQGGGATLCSP